MSRVGGETAETIHPHLADKPVEATWTPNLSVVSSNLTSVATIIIYGHRRKSKEQEKIYKYRKI